LAWEAKRRNRRFAALHVCGLELQMRMAHAFTQHKTRRVMTIVYISSQGVMLACVSSNTQECGVCGARSGRLRKAVRKQSLWQILRNAAQSGLTKDAL
jgi:hypothetical protein